MLPLRSASNLTHPEVAAHVLSRSDGLIGAVTGLLHQAAVRAVRSDHEGIDCEMLDQVRTTTPAARRRSKASPHPSCYSDPIFRRSAVHPANPSSLRSEVESAAAVTWYASAEHRGG